MAHVFFFARCVKGIFGPFRAWIGRWGGGVKNGFTFCRGEGRRERGKGKQEKMDPSLVLRVRACAVRVVIHRERKGKRGKGES